MQDQPVIRIADPVEDSAAIERLCWAYRDDLLALEGDAGRAAQAVFTEPFWQAMIDSLPAVHARPNGVILLAENDGHAVGCGMLHPLSDRDAEIKRLFIAPEARGTGTGKRLTCALVTHARQHGYARVMLDTTNGHVTAAGLYSSLGFTRRGPYAEAPPGLLSVLLYFELTL